MFSRGALEQPHSDDETICSPTEVGAEVYDEHGEEESIILVEQDGAAGTGVAGFKSEGFTSAHALRKANLIRRVDRWRNECCGYVQKTTAE